MSQEQPSFFAELSRRKVFRAAIFYLGITWALLQFADITFPRLDLPDWTVTLVMVLSMIGFPIVLVGAWAFDFNDGESGDSNADSDLHKMSPLRALALLLIIVLAGAVGHFYYTKLGYSAALEQAATEYDDAEALAQLTRLPEEASIAVLPFVNMSDDPANEYFSDGISEELLDALAKLNDIRVVARTSSFSFKGTNRDIRDIAQELNVATVLEGSVRKSGNDVRITAQLINAADGYHLWSDTYDRELIDIFAVQDEIAQSIVDALHLPLGLDKPDSLVSIGTQNIDAYNAYLQGLHFSKLLSKDNFDKAIVYLNQAVALDPTFAAPHGVLSYVHSVSILWNPPEVVIPLAVHSFETALQLDPKQGLALITKGQYLSVVERDWMEAKRYFVRGLEDESEKTWASFLYATMHLIPVGAFDKAREILTAAEADDPIDSRLKLASASLSLFEGDIFAAIAGYEKALEIDPANAPAASGVCTAYVQIGKFVEAQSIVTNWTMDTGQVNPWLLTCRGLLEMAQGQLDKAQATYHEMSAIAQHQKGFAFLVGDIALATGKIEEAMDWFERSLAAGEVGILVIRTRLLQQPEILAHPRMQNILQALHLDDASLQEMGYLPKPM